MRAYITGNDERSGIHVGNGPNAQARLSGWRISPRGSPLLLRSPGNQRFEFARASSSRSPRSWRQTDHTRVLIASPPDGNGSSFRLTAYGKAASRPTCSLCNLATPSIQRPLRRSHTETPARDSVFVAHGTGVAPSARCCWHGCRRTRSPLHAMLAAGMKRACGSGGVRGAGAQALELPLPSDPVPPVRAVDRVASRCRRSGGSARPGAWH